MCIPLELVGGCLAGDQRLMDILDVVWVQSQDYLISVRIYIDMAL